MKKMLFMLLTMMLILSCNEDETCMKEMSVYDTSVSTSAKVSNENINQRMSQTVITSPMSADVIVTDGDAIATGGLNTNGYDLTVENGDLIVNGSFNGDSNTVINVSGTFDMNGSLNMNGMEIFCDTAIVFGSLNGPGFIYYCSDKDFTGTKNNNNPGNQNIFQESTHCQVLSTGQPSLNYIGTEMVDCSMENGVRLGNKQYFDIN